MGPDPESRISKARFWLLADRADDEAHGFHCFAYPGPDGDPGATTGLQAAVGRASLAVSVRRASPQRRRELSRC